MREVHKFFTRQKSCKKCCGSVQQLFLEQDFLRASFCYCKVYIFANLIEASISESLVNYLELHIVQKAQN
jgi:hypothetical protein